ncbi:unnamed protein product, partial [Prorocentrum cordatum]
YDDHYHALPAGVPCSQVDHLDTITELELCTRYALQEHGQASPDEQDLGAQGCWYFERTQRVIFSQSGVSDASFTDYRSICLGVYHIYPEAYTVAPQGTTCADISLTTLSDGKICRSYANALGLNFSVSDQMGLYGCMYLGPVMQVVFSSSAVSGQHPEFSDYRSVCEGSTTTTTGTTLSSSSSTTLSTYVAPTAEQIATKAAGTWQTAVIVLIVLGGIGFLVMMIGCMVQRAHQLRTWTAKRVPHESF